MLYTPLIALIFILFSFITENTSASMSIKDLFFLQPIPKAKFLGTRFMVKSKGLIFLGEIHIPISSFCKVKFSGSSPLILTSLNRPIFLSSKILPDIILISFILLLV